MLKETTLYTAICDGCEKELFENENFKYGDEILLELTLSESGWHDTGNFYFCPKCHTIDENNEVKFTYKPKQNETNN